MIPALDGVAALDHPWSEYSAFESDGDVSGLDGFSEFEAEDYEAPSLQSALARSRLPPAPVPPYPSWIKARLVKLWELRVESNPKKHYQHPCDVISANFTSTTESHNDYLLKLRDQRTQTVHCPPLTSDPKKLFVAGGLPCSVKGGGA